MGAEQLCKMVGRQEAAVEAEGLLRPHQRRLDQRPCQHHEGQHHIHDADLLVIGAGQPLRPQHAPFAIFGDQRDGYDRADDHHQGRAGGDDAIDHVPFGWIVQHLPERQRFQTQPPQWVLKDIGNIHCTFSVAGAAGLCAAGAVVLAGSWGAFAGATIVPPMVALTTAGNNAAVAPRK